MKLTFLGTSAANAYPEPFCNCSNCQEARVYGGSSLRKRSSMLVNDDLLVDLGPDVLVASNLHGVPLTGVQVCLQTHAHADHIDPSHFLSRSPGYGVIGAPRLHFYASPGSLRVIATLLARDCEPYGFSHPAITDRLNLQVHPIEALQTVVTGQYLVTAFAANHDPVVDPLLYGIQSKDQSIFYGTDTAALPEETWRGFHDLGMRFDWVILDHTYGPTERTSDHLCARDFVAHIQRMQEEKLVTRNARFFATHIAHEGNPPHPVLSDFALKNGYEIAFDGLSLTS